jgi:transcriptional regulator with XRE-family HTH domain/nitrogen regulatory protein PII-like uncharacterized protein
VPGFSELFALLRPLRIRAGLTQAQVAAALGKKGKPGVTVISRLEHGRFGNPSLRLVLDYLRVCRANHEDTARVFNSYLSEPLEVPALPNRKTRGRPRGPRRTAEDEAILKLRREAAVWILRQVTEYMLHFEMNQIGAPRFHKVRQASVLFGRRVFRILLATRHKTEKAREKRLARARAWADKRAVPAQAAEHLQARVSDLFSDMEKDGELDWLPDEEHARKVMLSSARRRLLTDWNMCREENAIERKKQFDEYLKLSEPVIKGAMNLLAAAGISGSNLGNYRGLIPSFITIAGTTQPGSAERLKKLDYLLSITTRRWHDPALLRQLAGFVFEHWDAINPATPT